MAWSIKYTKLNRRGCDIILPTKVYNQLKENNISVSITNQGSVQLFNTKNHKYMGTLKSYMGATSFKNGNPCDFHVSNLI